MDEPKKPLLSICIPTYKRAELLRSSLLSIGPQLLDLGGDVELVVSDNCSPDDTSQVIAEMMKAYPIRCHRNDDNVGAIKNVIILANDLARGEYCWILGDDDLIKPGGIAKVLETLRANPEVDFVYVNFSHLDLVDFQRHPQPATSFTIGDRLRPGNEINGEFSLNRWEELLDPKISPVFLGAIQSSVVRRSIWTENAHSLKIEEIYSNLDSTYPHIVIYAKGLVGRKAYYIGTPNIIVIDGSRDWVGYVPIIVLARLNEALDLYQQMGVDEKRIRRCRKALLVMCGGSFYDLIFNPTSCGREYFSLLAFLHKYGLTVGFILGFVDRFVAVNIRARNPNGLLLGFRLAFMRLFHRRAKDDVGGSQSFGSTSE